MKKIFQNIEVSSKGLLLILAVVGLFSSCYKDEKLYTKKEGVSYMPQAYQDRNKLNLLKVDSAQTTTFGFYYTGFDGAPTDITGQFAVDNSLVAKYNAFNAYTGNVYQVLPANSYTLSGTSTVVKQGKTTSEPLSLTINPKSLTLGVKYMIPIRLTSVSSGTIDSSLSVTYFKIDDISIRSKDVTNQGILTGNHLNSPGSENLPKLTDGNYNSKYLAFDYTSSLYVQLAFDNATKIDAYTITSGNDAPERDPFDWNLQGSNDGTSWTTVDARSGETFSGRNFTRRFDLANEANYKYYRMNITKINGAGLIQISEWRLLDFY